MRTAVLDRWEHTGIVIMAAAVGDYHVKNAAGEKIKRDGPIELQLEPNLDILADLGSLRQASGKETPLLIGFAAETEYLLENARSKLGKKRVDAIVLNDVSRSDIGFNTDCNEVTIVTATETIAVPKADKLKIAQKILDAVVRLRQQPATLVSSPVHS
jgi:phosphopantothenoylcysteine decarboxylase/phosphopantothenate--cysteine ligase